MFFIYSSDLFLLNKQQQKIIKQIQATGVETEIKTYSWIEDEDWKIIDDILTPSFFVDQKIILVKDAYFLSEKKIDNHWVKNDNKKIIQLLNHPELTNQVIFTLNEPKISHKLKLTKEFETKAKVIDLQELDFDQMVQFVTKKVASYEKVMDEPTIKFFLDQLPKEMQVVNNELVKLLNLETKVIDQTVVKDNVSHYFSSDVYKLSDYFQNNEIEPFILEFQNYLSSSSDLIRLIYLLDTNLSFTRDCLLLKKSGKSEATIAKLLDAHPYRVKIALTKKNLNIKGLNDKILVLYDLNKSLVSGVCEPTVNAELELIKSMSNKE